MKIILLVSSLGAGGAERVATTLCNAWATRGDQVTLVPTFSGGGECFYELSPDVRLVYLADMVPRRKRSFVNQIARLKALRRFLTAERPDVIVSFLSNVNVAVIIASAGLGIPVVVCERTDPFICPTPLMLKIARRLTYPFADSLVVQTKAVANRLVAANWNLRKVQVIPNPIPQQLLDMQMRSNGAGERRLLLAVGRLGEEKQFSMLIKVFSRLAQQHTNWALRIVGEGPLRVALQQQIIDLDLGDRVELPGRTVNISDELDRADAFVLTSRFEGFPNVLLEAMAVGLPCATFDCPSGPREMSMEGKAAILVPLNDEHALGHALSRLMLDEDLRQSLGRCARASVIERFSLDKVLEKWDSLFKELEIRH
jgi:GalNAc-alpha-(1->4)-GalNAc-alpha-(1->3)-diNAcBac-PP-undecaprenol alpha-1,4-N-acetyl-D-galactosaminyltransferase